MIPAPTVAAPTVAAAAAVAPARTHAVTATPSAIIVTVRLVEASHVVVLAIITDADAGHCAGR
jgi:hypothetical protein